MKGKEMGRACGMCGVQDRYIQDHCLSTCSTVGVLRACIFELVDGQETPNVNVKL